MPDITMPQLGETVTEGTITKWFKKVGEQVAEDEPLFEVSTDKVDSEVPSSASGYVAEILVEEGRTVDVGERLAVITAEPPSGDGDGRAAAGTAPPPPAAEPDGVDVGTTLPEDADVRPPRAEAEAATAVRGPSDQPAPQEAPAPRRAPTGAARGVAVAEPSSRTGGLLLSPVVRRLIHENDLDPADIRGTGQDGRITRADVLAYIDRTAGQRGPRPAPAPPPAARATPPRPAPTPAAAAAVPRPAAKPGTDDEVVPFSNIRRRTAEHMVRSQATSAHVLVATEVDYSAVEKVRLAVRQEFKAREGVSLTYLPFIGRAVIDALDDFPNVNSSVGDDELVLHRRVHLAIAVDLNFEGLIVPVVHNADQLRLGALATAMADLARRARSRELTADDISGGTFTITNPGPFGTFLTFPVINQPQVAILSTDGIRKRPVAVELADGTDAVAVHPVGMLGLAFDHRAFDGAYASAFLGRVKEIIETRDWSQEV
jgi:2-oxoglutarate dehydrogenase E2 component (dihydrolipoamide succinyltransferase)